MWNRLVFVFNRLRERLWVRPLLMSVLSVLAALLARAADDLGLDGNVPEIDPDSIETLLSITASSMLVIATLAVTSMVAAYSSASNTATPRSFSLLVSDDLSQNALSTFLGAFIFSFVALVALKNGYFSNTGLFVLFLMTVAVVAVVVVTFVRWVDWIARLGRIGTTVDKVEAAGMDAFRRRRLDDRLGGADVASEDVDGEPVYADAIGYVQHVNVEALQECAEAHGMRIRVEALPGVFVAPGRALVHLQRDSGNKPEGESDSAPDADGIRAAFAIGENRVYDDDPRFSLVALSEIASRALSPAVNDAGTAITIFGSFIRLFDAYAKPLAEDEKREVRFDRVLVPQISAEEMLEDAFRAIARDGAALVEVQIRLQKALRAIAAMPHDRLARAAEKQSRAALERAERAISHKPDFERVREAAAWSAPGG